MVCLPYIDRSSPIYRQFASDIQIIHVPSIDRSRPIHSSFVKEVQFLAYVLHIQLVLCKKHGCIFCILCIRNLFRIFSEKPLSLKESFRLLFVRNKAQRASLLYESEPKKNAEPPKVLRIHKIKRGRRTYTQYYMSLVHLQKIRFFHIQRSNISMFLFQA